MKVVIFGLGSIGLRHAKLLKKRKGVELWAFRTGKGQAKNSLKIREITRWQDIDRIKPDVAFITNPTSLHIQTAIECAKRGMHLFIEKPLDCQTKDLNRLLKIVKQKKLSTYVAYVLRFHPVIELLRQQVKKQRPFHVRATASTYLHRWRKGFDTKKNYSARKKMGGGVIWDLSHEIDYIQYILGPVQNIDGRFSRRSSITVDSEDNADLFIETKRSPANVHISYFGQKEERRIQIDFEDRTLEGDLLKSTITEYRGGVLRKKRKLKRSIKDSYDRQLNYFMKHLNSRNMMNNIFEASELFKKICNFKTG